MSAAWKAAGVLTTLISPLRIDYDDLIIDPACGTGGFLVETCVQMQQALGTGLSKRISDSRH
jgi:type I restriction-modification system DNA methylase subunit